MINVVKLEQLILEKYKNLNIFCNENKLNYTKIYLILQGKTKNPSVNLMLEITKVLNISLYDIVD